MYDTKQGFDYTATACSLLTSSDRFGFKAPSTSEGQWPGPCHHITNTEEAERLCLHMVTLVVWSNTDIQWPPRLGSATHKAR